MVAGATALRRAITVEEFGFSLKTISPIFASGVTSGFGLAVSGGVDSSALGWLCKELFRPDREAPERTLHAFIVDHGIRQSSREEAEAVRERLNKEGLSPHVLTLKWPTKERPTPELQFETEARKLRYQALGKACLKYNVHTLLSGHHADDQAETVLMRLSKWHQGRALTGIPRDAIIPECGGLFGIDHRSVDPETFMESPKVLPMRGMDLRSKPNQLQMRPGACASDGIKLLRPLLRFPKERLIETCHAAQISWAEDTTNHDPSITARNSIRFMMQNFQLPRALQRSSLVDIANRTTRKTANEKAVALKTFQDCYAELDQRIGRLTVVMTLSPTVQSFLQQEWPLAYFLAHCMAMISPQPGISVPQILNAVAREIINIMLPVHKDSIWKKVFSASGVAVKVQVEQPRSRKPSGLQLKWSFEREPRPRNEKLPILEMASASATNIGAFHSSKDSHLMKLWDGRWWIRYQPFSDPIQGTRNIIRPFKEADLEGFRASLPQKTRLQLRNENMRPRLSEMVRSGVPALVAMKDRADGKVSQGKVVYLPTIGLGAVPRGMDIAVAFKDVG